MEKDTGRRRAISAAQWIAAREMAEGAAQTHARIATLLGCDVSAVYARASAEGWKRLDFRRVDVREAQRHLAQAIVPSLPHAVFLDLPMGPQSGPSEDQFRVAARARPWRGQLVLASPEATGFAERTTIAAPATMGRLVQGLGGGVEGRVDRAGEVVVELIEGELSSVTTVAMLNGTNAAAVRSLAGAWEVLQFQSAEEFAPSIWRLTTLLRGQLGTGDAMLAGAAVGADFVLLDEKTVPAGLRPSEVGLQLNWRVVPLGADLDGAFHAQAIETGGLRALTPLAPVHARLRREGTDAVITWVRRGRIDADGWAGTDIPLGEEDEVYSVEIGPPEVAPLRAFEVGEPRLAYPLAEIEADFGMLPAEIEVTIRQLSRAVGAGLATTRRLEL